MVAVSAPAGFIDEPPTPKRKPLRATPELISAMIQAESGGDPAAVSLAGARGLMQLMPGTAKDKGVTDVFDPEQNVQGGTQYINDMLDKYDDPELALMAYNWGPSNVDKWVAGGRKGQVPAETKNYLAKLLPVAEKVGRGSAEAGQQPQPQPQPAPVMAAAPAPVTPPAFEPAPGPLAANWRSPTAAPAAPPDPRFAALAAGGPGFNAIPGTPTPTPPAPPPQAVAPATVAGPAGAPPAPPGFVDEGAPPPPAGFVDEGQVPKPAGDSGFFHEFAQGFKGGLVGTNGMMAGEALQVIGRRTGYNDLVTAGKSISEFSKGEAAKYPTRVPSIENIRTDSIGNLANDTMAYLGGSGGQGTSSMVPTITAALAVGVLTKNPYAAVLGGAIGPSYVQNLGDVSSGLKDELGAKIKAGEVSQEKVDNAALLAAIPMAALDLVGVGAITKTALAGPRKELRRRVVKFLAGAVLKNMSVEGITEGLQEVISQWTQAYLGDAPLLTRKRFVAVIDNLVGGAIPGAIFGAGGGAANVARHAVTKPEDETVPQPEAADQPQPESAPAGPGVQPAPPAGTADTGQQPPGAPPPPAGEPGSPAPQEPGQEPGAPQAPTAAPVIPQPKGAPALGATVQVTNPALEDTVGTGVVEGYIADDTGAPVAQVRLENGDLAEYQVGLHTFETLKAPVPGTATAVAETPASVAQPAPVVAAPVPDTATTEPAPGTAAAPIEVKTEADIEAASQHVETAPTEKQKESGTYQKGHVKLHGLDVTIENPKGSVRSGKIGGKTWSVTMPAAYGYIKRSEGADGDQVDVYLGPKPESAQVFVIEQKNLKTGKFDEHKVMMGFGSVGAARKAYVAAFSDGKGNKRIMSVTQYDIGAFKTALDEGKFKKRKARKGQPGAGGYKGRESLLVFIARLGGMTDPTGELRAMDAHKWRKPFLKKLIQEGGLDPDKIREAAVEAGYLRGDDDPNAPATSTVDDLYQAISEELQGRPVYPPHIAAEFDAEDAQAAGADQERHDLEREAELLGIDLDALGKIDNEALRDIVLQAMARAETPETIETIDDTIDDAADAAKREAMTAEDLTDEEIQAIAEAGAPGQKPGLEAPFEGQDEEPAGRRKTARNNAPAEGPQADGARGRAPKDVNQDAAQGPGQPAEGVAPDNLVIETGVVLRTKSGRETAPAPKIDATSERKTANTLKRMYAWLLDEAKKEAAGNDYVTTLLKAINLDNLSQSDQDTINEVLFGAQAATQANVVRVEKPKPTTEKTAAGEQGVIPGTERTTGKEFVEAQADKRKKGKGAQKAADEGLFDVSGRGQTDVEKPAAPARLEDVGEKIGGARKDRWAERGLALSDLEDMTGGEEAQYVTKNQVWPVPDYASLINGGKDPATIALVKLVRDRLAAKPRVDTAKGRRDYIKMLGWVRDALMAAETVDDVRNMRKAIIYDADKVNWGEGWRGTGEARELLFSIFTGRSERLDVGHRDAFKAKQLLESGWPFKKKETKARTKDEKVLPVRPHLDRIERTGADLRQGRDITAEDFMTSFGFRGVEFGNWVAGDERQTTVNLAYEALHDLAGVLGVPPQALSLRGTMALAFGARGGGRFAAHYEPGKLVINLTKLSGAGALAHEWGHALDHYFGELNTEKPYGGSAKGASGWYTHTRLDDSRLANLRPEMRDAFNALMGALYQREQTKAEEVRDAELRLEKAQAELARVEKDLEKHKGDNFAKRLEKWAREWGRPHVRRMQAALEKARGRIEGETGRKVKSSYYRNALKLSGKSGDKGYWARPTELFARAFEAYIFDKIGIAGNVSQYLVQGVADSTYASDVYKGDPYPAQEERQAINAAFDKIFETMAVRESEGGPELYSMARPFYSALTRAVEAAGQPAAPATQWAGIIDNLAGVKQEEIAWSGVKEWLAEQKGRVTKEQVVDFLRANEVRIDEVVKGDLPGNEGRFEIFNPQTAEVRFVVDTEEEAQAIIEDHADLLDYALVGEDVFGNQVRTAATKFGQWQVPGGENYREFLLTLPVNYSALSERRAALAKIRLGETLDDGRTVAEHIDEIDRAIEAAKDNAFTAGHFDEPNVLVHVRFNERTDADGKRTLFIEEVQSDWHQKGRARGYVNRTVYELRYKGDLLGQFDTHEEAAARRDETFRHSTDVEIIPREVGTGIPDAPFKATWHQLALKRMLRYAAENGFDQLAWTPGEIQNDRYDLSKQVDAVEVRRISDDVREVKVFRGGDIIMAMQYDKAGKVFAATQEALENQHLSDVLGKELADKVLAVPEAEIPAPVTELPEEYATIHDSHQSADRQWSVYRPAQGHAAPAWGRHATERQAIDEALRNINENRAADARQNIKTFEGLDLKIGGKGMIGFYDKMLPAFLNKYAKKWGAKVGTAEIGDRTKVTGRYDLVKSGGGWRIIDLGSANADYIGPVFRSGAEAEAYLHEKGLVRTTVHALPITDAMRESVMQGQPLFARQGPEADARRTAARSEITAAIVDELRRMAPAADLDIVQGIVAGAGAEASGGQAGGQALGRYLNGVITLAYDAMRSPQHARAVAGHEGIHFLRDAGFFTKGEWATLEAESRKSWIAKHNLPARPGDETVVEEGIAYEYQEWRTNPRSLTRVGPVHAIFRRMMMFLRRLGNALRMRGFQSAKDIEDIFIRTATGEIGRRTPGTGRVGRQAMYVAEEVISTGPDGRTNRFDRDLTHWRRQIARALSGQPMDRALALGRMFYVLREMKAAAGPVALDQGIARAIQRKHPDIPRAVWDALPELVADPIYVHARQDGTTSVVLDATTENGDPIIVGLRGGEIRTITPKDSRDGESGHERMLAAVAQSREAGNRVYARDQNALDRLRSVTGYNRRRGAVADGATRRGRPGNIVQREDVIKAQGRIMYASAWHGGPHDFDEFSTEKIGTGEGNQTFGWGLYFAGAKGVAEHYKRKLSNQSSILIRGQKPSEATANEWAQSAIKTIAQDMEINGRDFDLAKREALGDLTNRKKLAEVLDPSEREQIQGAVDFINAIKDGDITTYSGRLYQVDLAPAEDEYLRWDLPLDQQSDKVKAALAEALDEQTFADMQDLAESYDLNAPENATDSDYKGGQLYDYMAKLAGEGPYFDVPAEVNSAEEEVSNWLRQHGIRGVKFLDQQSRGVPDKTLLNTFGDKATAERWAKINGGEIERGLNGWNVVRRNKTTYNYVIFDAADVKIEAKYAMDRVGDTPVEKALPASQKRHASSVMDAIHNRIGWMFDPLGKLPEVKKYLGLRYRTLGKIAKVEEMARGLYDIFAAATAVDQKAAYDFLTTRGAKPDAIKSAETRANAVRAKQQIDQVGRDLVRQGLLQRETYEAHRGEYLPRVYLKHLLGGPNNFGKGTKVSDLGYLKQRKDIPESVRQLILGEITDPGFLAAKGVSQPMRDIAILQFLEQIAGNKTWIYPKSLIEWEGKKVSLMWLSQESARIAEQAAYIKDKDLAAASLELARKMGDMAAAANAKIDKVPTEYKQVPDAKRYGRLRGMWVRKEIYDDLIGSIRMLPADDSIAERVLGHGGVATKATQIWKLSKVALNPPTQVRNFMSNAVLLHLSGVPLWRLPGRIVQAAREMAHNGKHWKIAKKYGVTATTFSNTELLRIEREMLDIYGRAGVIGQLRRIAGLVAQFAGDTYQLSESLFKTAKIMDAMGKGMSEEDAALEAQKWLFDYSLVAPSVRYLRSAPVGVPFITFYTKALPRIVEVAVTAPWRYLPYVILPIVLSQMIANEYDVDDDDLDKLKLALPEWMRNKSNVLLLPYKDAHGRWQAFDLGYMYPWGMYQEFYNEVAKGQAGQALGTTGLLGGPLPDLIAAVKTGIDPFTKRPIANEFDPPARQVADMMQYLWRMAAPTWVTDIGFAGHMYRTLTGTVNAKTGAEPLTLPQSAARLFGSNIYPIDPESSLANNIRWMRYDISKIQQRARQMLRNPNLDDTERKNIEAEYTDLIERRAKQLMEYAEAARVHPNLATQRAP